MQNGKLHAGICERFNVATKLAKKGISKHVSDAVHQIKFKGR